jgi:RNA 3'-terminal phosphate cyclase (ATP)
MLTIDGSRGEGGGQILRTSLALSMITGTPVRIDNIRAKRRKPGLLRQHLTCVTAAEKISSAKVSGGTLGSKSIVFEPGAISGGDYEFAIGSAGSTVLVFQTILPALLRATAPSRVTLSGGTHNPFAPTFDYLQRAFLPQLARMGAVVETKLHKPGFYPAGGGKWLARISPQPNLLPLALGAPGQIKTRSIRADVGNIAFNVAEREAAMVANLLSWPPSTIRCSTVNADGEGNVLWVELDCENVTEIITGFGERAKSSEAVAAEVVAEVRAYLMANAPVGPYLADQLLLPMALAGGGTFVTMALSEHARTNIEVIEKFLAVDFAVEALDGKRWQVTVRS